MLQTTVEIFRVFGQPEGFEFGRSALCVLAHQYKIARVRHQYQPIAVPVAADLITRRSQPSIITCRFHLNYAAIRNLSLSRLAFLHLLGRVEAEVGMARALVGKLANAKHLRLERCPDGVQQVLKRPIARHLPGRTTRRADSPEIGEVGFNCCPGFRVHSDHVCLCSFIY